MRKSGKYLTAAILAVSMAATPITSYGFGWSKTEAAEEKKEESYVFKAGDTVISMGAEAAPILKALGEAKSTFEQDSCAYQGKSRIYTYENFELGTSTASGKECVESIYIAGASGTAATQEGVETGSKKEDVIKAYGKDYKEDFGTLRYTLGNCQLSFHIILPERGRIQWRPPLHWSYRRKAGSFPGYNGGSRNPPYNPCRRP